MGGTCNGSTWRDDLIKMLAGSDVSYFNPVVDDWNEEAQVNEEREKRLCDYHLFCFTPKMSGFYAIAEVVNSAHQNPEGTIICFLETDGIDDDRPDAVRPRTFTSSQINSLEAVARMVTSLAGMWAPDLESVAEILKSGVKSYPGIEKVEA